MDINNESNLNNLNALVVQEVIINRTTIELVDLINM